MKLMVRLNLGCNKHRLGGYIGVDIMSYAEADIQADACCLPFADGSIDDIYAGHLLEHLANPVDFFLECWRVLKYRARLSIVIPDVSAIQEHPEMAVGILFGFYLKDGRPDPAVRPSLHRTWWTPSLLRDVAEQCGFRWLDRIDLQHDPRLVSRIGWQVGAEFAKVNLDPTIPYAAQLYHQIDRGEI